MKKIRSLLLSSLALIIFLSFSSSAIATSDSIASETKNGLIKEISIPIKLESTENLYPQNSALDSVSPQATTLVGRVDLRVREISGNFVVLDWDVVVTTPGALIVNVGINIIWDNVFIDPFHYSTFGVPTSVYNQSQRTVSDGFHLVSMTGGVGTTLGNYYIITPPTVFFEV